MEVTSIASLIYELSLCFICFFFYISVYYLTYKNESEFIRRGYRDDEVKKKKYKKRSKNQNRIKNGFSWSFLGILFIICGFFVYTRLDPTSIKYTKYQLLAVESGSMSQKYEKNDYLVENNLNNQFQTNSLIVIKYVDFNETANKPQLYDVYAYKKNGATVIHRIVGLAKYENNNFVSLSPENYQEANYYIFKGDANLSNDTTYVSLDQLYGKYIDKEYKGVGTIFNYINSGFGLVAISTAGGILISSSIMNDKLKKEYLKRREIIDSGVVEENNNFNKKESLLVENKKAQEIKNEIVPISDNSINQNENIEEEVNDNIAEVIDTSKTDTHVEEKDEYSDIEPVKEDINNNIYENDLSSTEVEEDNETNIETTNDNLDINDIISDYMTDENEEMVESNNQNDIDNEINIEEYEDINEEIVDVPTENIGEETIEEAKTNVLKEEENDNTFVLKSSNVGYVSKNKFNKKEEKKHRKKIMVSTSNEEDKHSLIKKQKNKKKTIKRAL